MNRRTLLVAFLPLLTADLYTVWHRRDWVGEWNWTIDMSVGAATLSGPVLAVVGGAVGLGLRRTMPLLTPQSRRLKVAGRAIAEVWLTGVAALAVSTATALGATASTTHGGALTAGALALGPAVLLTASVAGIAIGYLLGTWVSVALVGPAFFLVGGLSPGWLEAFFRQGPVSGSLAGLAYSGVQAAAVVVGALAMWFLAAALIAARGRRAGALAIVAATMLALAMAASYRNLGERFVPGDERATACREAARVTVCVAPSNVAGLQRLSLSVAQAAQELRRWGVEMPARFDDPVPYGPPIPPDRGLLGESLGVGDPYWLVVSPAPCRQWFDPGQPPPQGAIDAQRLIVDLLTVRAGGRPISGQFEPWLREATIAEQRDWLVATYDLLRQCRLDEIRLPAT